MKNLKNKMKSKEGITLIALVITIIVLVILAGVAIITLTGENGILERAKVAKERTIEAENEEKERLAGYENEMENFYARQTSGGTNTTISRNIINLFEGGGNYTTTAERQHQLIPFEYSNSVGDKLTYSENGVIIGEGVSKVLVTYNYGVEHNGNISYFAGKVFKNDVEVGISTIYQVIKTGDGGISNSFLLDVNKDDKLTGKIFARTAGSFVLGRNSLIVEVVE